jgi:hypothetical protein
MIRPTKLSLLLWILLAGGWILLIALSWSPSPYWQDALNYTRYISQGQYVGHPPGYFFFLLISHAFYAIIPSAYAALQASSFLLAALSLLILPLLIYRATASLPITSSLALAFAFSWGVLIIAQTGTSHSSDLLTVSLLLLACLPFFQSSSPSLLQHAFLGFAIVMVAGFRFTTLLFHVPLLAFLAIHHCFLSGDKTSRLSRIRSIIATYAITAVTIGAIQLLVIHLSGGWQPYSEYAASMHEVNRPSSVLLSGMKNSSLLNIFRAFLWYTLAAGPLLLLAFSIRRDNFRNPLFLAGILSTGSVLALSAAYICPHPGYFSAALPGLFLAAAKILENKAHKTQSDRIRWIPISAAVFGILLFVALKPIPKPSSPQHAALNGLLLQYGLSAARQSTFFSTSEWLIIGGFEHLVPPQRVEEIKRHGQYLPPEPE